MQIEKVIVSEYRTNCYIVTKDNKTLLIDPGDDAEKIESMLQGLNVVGILVTHNHSDHIGALDYFEKKYHLHHNEKCQEFIYETIKTPGHTKDSVTFYFPDEKMMFTGDFLFYNTIGRMDFPGGSEKEMQESLEQIKNYPDDITIYPGHGPKTNLGHEKKNFPYYF